MLVFSASCNGCSEGKLVKVVAANRPIFFQGFPRDFEQAAHFEDEVRTFFNQKITLEEKLNLIENTTDESCRYGTAE